MEIRHSTVSELVDKAMLGTINIPIFQREFEWDKNRVELLLDSLIRGYPIGSLLFWNAEYAFPKSTSLSKRADWIIDGQQRVTSLCILFNKKPYWWEGKKRAWNKILKENTIWVNIRNNEPTFSSRIPHDDKLSWISIQQILSIEDDNELKIFIDGLAGKIVQQDVLFLEESQEIGKGYTAIEESDIFEEDDDYIENEVATENESIAFFYDSYENIHDLARKIESRFRKYQNIKTIQIPQIVTKKPPRDMARIFTRLNRGGKKLTTTDVFLSVLSSALPKWVKNDFGPFCDEITQQSGITLDPSHYVRTLTAYALKTVDTQKLIGEKSDQLLTPTKIRNSWNEIKPAIVDVLHGLWDRGIQSEKVIPSKSTIIPLFLMKSIHHSTFDMDKALNWFMAANFNGYRSDSLLNYDVNIIHESNDFLSARNKLLSEDEIGFKWQFDKEEFDRKRKSSIRVYKMILYLLLYNRGAKDWFTGGRIGYQSTNNDWSRGYKPHWHHIFPKARIQSKSKIGLVDSFANLTVINERTNISIRDSRPIDYLQEISTKQLKCHMIPLDEDLWEIRRFHSFTSARADLITREINRYIKKLG